ncbi:MAG: hypothetical protein WCF68_00455 [Terriglobales bacterium]
MRQIRKLLLAIFACCTLSGSLFAQNVTTVTSCPKRPTLPVTFEVDCSHLADPTTQQLCKPFAENQASKVFWAYRNITGIRLEESCPTFKYTIYEKDKFPHPAGEGGVALRCGADYVADYSVLIKSDIGPYDVHEILHVYQQDLGALPYQHILFGPSIAEARKEIGDEKGFEDAMTRLKAEMKGTEAGFEKGIIRPESQCPSAELFTEASLYLKDSKNVEQFYRKLDRGRSKDMAERQARFNRMYDAVSGGAAKKYLLEHCPRF